jgi:hypothetical protein
MTGGSRFRLLVGFAVVRSMIIDNNTLLDINRGGGGGSIRFKDHGLLRVSVPLGLWFLSIVPSGVSNSRLEETFVASKSPLRPRFAVGTVPNGGRKLGPRDFEKM